MILVLLFQVIYFLLKKRLLFIVLFFNVNHFFVYFVLPGVNLDKWKILRGGLESTYTLIR